MSGSVNQLNKGNTLGFIASSGSLEKPSQLATGIALPKAGWLGEFYYSGLDFFLFLINTHCYNLQKLRVSK